MKPLRKLCVALTLTFLLAITSFAGEIHTTITPPPVPTAATDGEIQTGVAGQIDTTSSEANAGDFALSLMQSVLGLF